MNSARAPSGCSRATGQSSAAKWTPGERDRIAGELDQKLGREYLDVTRVFRNANTYFLRSEQAHELADQIFGRGSWTVEEKWHVLNYELAQAPSRGAASSATTSEYEVSVCVCCRVALQDGSFQEDIGNGVFTHSSKASAYTQAKQYATNDATKRCLRKFGNALGNCLYDKSYTSFLDRIPNA